MVRKFTDILDNKQTQVKLQVVESFECTVPMESSKLRRIFDTQFSTIVTDDCRPYCEFALFDTAYSRQGAPQKRELQVDLLRVEDHGLRCTTEDIVLAALSQGYSFPPRSLAVQLAEKKPSFTVTRSSRDATWKEASFPDNYPHIFLGDPVERKIDTLDGRVAGLYVPQWHAHDGYSDYDGMSTEYRELMYGDFFSTRGGREVYPFCKESGNTPLDLSAIRDDLRVHFAELRQRDNELKMAAHRYNEKGYRKDVPGGRYNPSEVRRRLVDRDTKEVQRMYEQYTSTHTSFFEAHFAHRSRTHKGLHTSNVWTLDI